MKRALVAMLLAVTVADGALVAPQVAAATPPGAISWVVNHRARTITVTVKLQIYSGCSGNPQGDRAERARACVGVSGQVTQFLANKIAGQMQRVWNRGYKYRCYRLIVVIDIKTAPDEEHVEPGRIAVRIDPSPVRIRSWVHVSDRDPDRWRSNDPADRIEPEGRGDTTWTERAHERGGGNTYAHELGHILGLDDAYHDEDNPNNPGETISVPNEGAPLDLMSTGGSNISQETIDRLIERNRDRLKDMNDNPVDLDDLKCERSFVAYLKSTDNYYGASFLVDSLVKPPCRPNPTDASTTQTIAVADADPLGVDVRLVEGAQYGPLGYTLSPEFDNLWAHTGVPAGTRSSAGIGMFDMPVEITVDREYDKPARGLIPQLLDLRNGACADEPGKPPPRLDCGQRKYNSWMSIEVSGTNEAWPVAARLPPTLAAVGPIEPRLGRLYRNCPGPFPWPGQPNQGQRVTPGQMPDLATISKVADQWYTDNIAGKVVISGRAEWSFNQPGKLVQYGPTNRSPSTYRWVLTLCPLNQDGAIPPNCP